MISSYTSANWGQIIGYYWFYPLLLAIIGYCCNYWLKLAILFCKKFSYYWLLLRQAPTLIIAIIVTLLLQLLVPLAIIGIIGNYCLLLILSALLVLILIYLFYNKLITLLQLIDIIDCYCNY
jgi:hypothetical protein